MVSAGGGSLFKAVIRNQFGNDPGTTTTITISTFGNQSNMTKAAINNSLGDTTGTSTTITTNPFGNQSSNNASVSAGLFQQIIYLAMTITMVI